MHQQISPDWRPGPLAPRLDPACVDIWRIDLEAPAQSAAPGSDRRAAANTAMRELIGRYLGVTAGQVVLARREGGKPCLDSPRATLEFNLSHCRGHALLALADGIEVGVDIEGLRRIAHPLRIAGRVLSSAEISLLSDAPDDDSRLACFLDLWTRMEARQKATGRGIFAQQVAPAAVTSFGFQPGEGLFACLAVTPPRRDLALRFYDYRAR